MSSSFFVFDQDSLTKAYGSTWQGTPKPEILGVTSLEDGMMIYARIADKRCLNEEAWVVDSTKIVVKETALYDHPHDQVVMYGDAKQTANEKDTIYFSIASSPDPNNIYQWYWTGYNKRVDPDTTQTNPSYDVLLGMYTTNQLSYKPYQRYQPGSFAAMRPVPPASLDPTFFWRDSATLGVIVNNGNFQILDSVMFACEVTSTGCGEKRIDTSYFARLIILPDELVLQGAKYVESLCTDNYMVIDSIVLHLHNKPTQNIPISYQWEVWDGNPDNHWAPLDRRKYRNTNRDTVTMTPVFAQTTQYWFRAKLNNSVYADTIEVDINYMPYFAGSSRTPLSRFGKVLTWPELRDDTGALAKPIYNPSGSPALLYVTQAAVGFPTNRDEVQSLIYQRPFGDYVSDDKADSNLVIFKWYRAEKNSDVFNLSTGQHPFPNPGSGTDTARDRWTLFHQQLREKDDSIHVALQLTNMAGCPGQSDTVMIVVPKCYIDSVTIPASVCVGESNVQVRVWPGTDQTHNWYYRLKGSSTRYPVKNSIYDDGTFEFRVATGDTVLYINNITPELDSIEFNVEVDNASCGINPMNWTRLNVESFRGDTNLYLNNGKLANDTLSMSAGEGSTQVLVRPDLPTGFEYEWHLISTADPAVDYIESAFTKDNDIYNLSFNGEWSGYQMYAKVRTPNGCEERLTDTIALIMNERFDVKLDSVSFEYCENDDREIIFEAIVDPDGTYSYEWYYNMKGTTSWNLITQTGNNFLVGDANQQTLRFSRLNNNYRNSQFRVIATSVSGLRDTSEARSPTFKTAIDLGSSYITRSPALGNIICVSAKDGAILTYTANAMVDGKPAPGTTTYEWKVRKWTGTAYEDVNAIPEAQKGTGKVWQLTDIDHSFHLAVVSVSANAGCIGLDFATDTIKLQDPDSINIRIDTSVICSTQPVKFDLHETPAFYPYYRITWEAPLGTSSTAHNNKTAIQANLSAGTRKVAVHVWAQGGGYSYRCETMDTVEVFIQEGTPLRILAGDPLVPTDNMYVDVNNYVDLELEPLREDGITPLEPHELIDVKYRWTILHEFDGIFPLTSTNTKTTQTATYTSSPVTQEIVGEFTDMKGCVSKDTITIKVGGAFNLDSVIVADHFRPELDDLLNLEQPNDDTTFVNELNSIIGRLNMCMNNIFYLTPHVSGGKPEYTFHWTVNKDVYVYDSAGSPLNNGNILPGNSLVTGTPPPAAPASGTPDVFSIVSTDSLTYTKLGFRPAGDINPDDSLVFWVWATSELTSAPTIVAAITMKFKPVPYVKMHSAPRTYGNAYYLNQAIYYHLGPERFERYDFYRFIRPEGEEFYKLLPDSTAVGVKNPQRDSIPVYVTTFVEGEDQNLVLGVAKRADGCQAWDTVSVRLVPVPNVVIPDDPIFPMNRVFLPDFDIEVHDTWGLPIKPYGSKGWDGTYNGKKIRSGTYYYNAKVPTPDGFMIISGAVTVLRTNPNDN